MLAFVLNRLDKFILFYLNCILHFKKIVAPWVCFLFICLFVFVGGFLSWEAAYQKELETFKDIGDVGEIW